MQISKIMRRLTSLIFVCLLLTACGQKGDLYLPEGKIAAFKTLLN